MNKILIIISSIFMSLLPINGNSFGWGFKKNKNHEQPFIGSYEKEIENTNSYYVGSNNQKCVFLTFDAGYDNGNLIQILDVLDSKDVNATFFITGDFLERFSNLVIEINKRNHIVGNHTWDHKNITTLNEKQLEQQLLKVEQKYKQLTGDDLDRFFRPPSGVFNNKSLKIVSNLNYNTMFWSIAYKDWETNNQNNIDYAVNSVIDNLHNGAIILLHTVSKTNVEALPIIIDKIREEGYSIQPIYKVIVQERDILI